MLIDSHVNLHHERFSEDLQEVIERARAAGVGAMLTISDKLASTDAIKTIVDTRKNIWRSVGVHPHYASDEPELDAARLIDLARDEKVVGIGECGLDFHYLHSPRAIQEKVFKAHIEAAQYSGLPLIVHTRDADDRMQEMLEHAHARGAFKPLLHCYTGGPALAEAALAMGGYISFSGIITFKNADDVRAVAKNTPLDRLIVETDCPYLAPVPMRGRRCEPGHVVHVAAKLAEIKGASVDDIHRATTENFFRLFSRARFETE